MKYLNYFLVVVFLFASSIMGQKKPFSIEALYKVKGVSGPNISPDGKKVIFMVSNSDFKKGKSNADVYIMDINGKNQKPLLNTEKSEISLGWYNNEEIIYQLGADLHKFNINSRADTKITDLPIDVSNPVFSPDGKSLIFETNIFPECKDDIECNKNTQESYDNSPVKAYMTDDLLFRHWTSYREEKEPHIFSLNLETKKVKDLVKSEWISSNFMLGGEVRYNFSPDGKQICFMSTEDKNSAASTNADLYTMNSDGSNIKRITENKSWDGYPVYSPDGKYIAYKLQTIENFEADRYRLALYDLKTNQIKILTEDFDYTINEFEWSNDSKSIYFTADVKGYAPVHKIDITTSAITNLTGNQTVMGFDIEKSGVMIYAATNVDKPREIFTFNLDTKKYEQLTSFNKDLLDEYDFRPVEQMWIEGAEGIKVHTFIVKPHNFDPNKKYPLVLNVHGGPQSQWMDAFRGDWQVYGGYGYIIAFCNPHGSTGYGSKYTEAISGDYGGKVFDDLMNVTDELEKLPYVDKDRIGAMGWSFGGYMMNWFQAKTKRFKCLASMMGIFDSESMWGATEELWFVNWDMKGQPWNSDNYEKYSPSNYAKDFSTPTLIITGEKDYRVPYTQSVQYFTTLKTLGIDARLVVFPNDGHWPSSVKSMPLYYNSHLEWFNKYLGGEPAPYDSHKLIKGTQFK